MYRIKVFANERDYLSPFDNFRDIEFTWRLNRQQTATDIFCANEEEREFNENWLRAVLPDGFEYVVEMISKS